MLHKTRIAPDFDSSAWRDWVNGLAETCDAARSDQALPGGRNELLLFHHQGRRVVVKRFRNRGLWKKIAYRIASSKACRSYEHSARIRQAGLSSPTPIAWLERWKGSWLHESFYVCDYLEFTHDAYALRDPSLPDRIEKARLVGESSARLHQAEIAHLDLNSGNLLFSQSPEGNWLLHLIDTNRMRFGPVSPRQGCALLLRADFEDDILEAMLSAYAQTRSYSIEPFRKRYLSKRARFRLNRRLRDATRPWRKRIGL